MANKKKGTPVEGIALPVSTAALMSDAENPRTIKAAAAIGLGKSLDTFGDLSGLVWNRRTQSLVCGHQRLDRIRSQWGDRPIELIDEKLGIYGIRVDAQRFFSVRIVDWSKAKQRAANVAANNQAIQGSFTEDVSAYLESIAEDLTREESPTVLQDLLLMDFLIAADESELRPVAIQKPPEMTWCLIGLPTVQWGSIAEVIVKLGEIPGITLETTSNDHKDGQS